MAHVADGASCRPRTGDMHLLNQDIRGGTGGEGMSPAEFFRYSLGRSPSRHAREAAARIRRARARAVLDVGCGVGLSLKQVAVEVPGCELLCGCDADERLLEYAVQDAPPDKDGPPPADCLCWVCNGPASLPFADGVFDFVFSEGALHHFAHHERMIAEMWRVLAPGGELVVMDLNPRAVLARGFSLFARVKNAMGLASKGEMALAESISGAFDSARIVRDAKRAGVHFETARTLAAVYYSARKRGFPEGRMTCASSGGRTGGRG